MVQPRHARAYFSACSDAPAVPHDAGIYKDCFGAEGTEPAKLEGHFHLTPYAHFPSRSATQPRVLGFQGFLCTACRGAAVPMQGCTRRELETAR